MRKHVSAAIVILPLLLAFAQAAQNWALDPQPVVAGVSSEDSGTSAYLGVDVSDITADRLDALKLKEEKGVEVTMVDEDAPAGKAGLKEHDVILTMNGESLESGAQLRRMIHETPAGRIVTLGVSRDGQPMTVKVQLGDRHKEFSYTAPKAKDFHVEIPPIPTMDFEVPGMNVVIVRSSGRTGLMVENITPQLGEFFGVKDGNGVLIRSVEKGSRGEKAGFRAGDIVVKVNGRPVHDTTDFTHALTSSSGSMPVSIVRDKKEQNLNLTLPERKDSGEWMEESLDDDESTNVSRSYELSRVKDEIAKLRPQMELAPQQARKTSQEAQKTVCQYSKQAQEQAKQWQNWEKQIGPQIEEKLKEQHEHLKQQMEKLQREMRGDWLDI